MSGPTSKIATKQETHIPGGDPDCKLGVKRSTNQELPDGSTKEKKETHLGLWLRRRRRLHA